MTDVMETILKCWANGGYSLGNFQAGLRKTIKISIRIADNLTEREQASTKNKSTVTPTPIHFILSAVHFII